MYNYTHFVSSTDRFGAEGSDEERILELSKKLKFPVEDILMAVREVGFDKDEVDEYVRDRYNRT